MRDLLQTNIQFLKGVGEKRAELYHKLGIFSISDLLEHYPKRYLDFSNPISVSAGQEGETVAISALVLKKNQIRLKGKTTVYKVLVGDDTGEMTLTIFNNYYLYHSLLEEKSYIFYGKVKWMGTQLEMSSPLVSKTQDPHQIKPIYPCTKGLSSQIVRNQLTTLFSQEVEIEDPLPLWLREEEGLLSKAEAIQEIHFPKTLESLDRAKHRLIFEELFYLRLGLKLLRDGTEKQKNQYPLSKDISSSHFLKKFSFVPTNDQIKALEDCKKEMQSTQRMNRLLMGDVGSGKTFVAMGLCDFMEQQGYQSCLMVPTEILAQQHYATFCNIFGEEKVVLLTGSCTKKQKKIGQERILSGQISVVIGTHALIEKEVEFCKLGLVITDEQHRFGVRQRAALAEKSPQPHTLIMTATPIPRTLALQIYGELQVSFLRNMPIGRIPIQTFAISSPKKQRAFGFVKEQLDLGYQGYIICPLVEEGEEDMGLKDVTSYGAYLQQGPFSTYKVGILHGKMKGKEKEEVMKGFSEQRYDLLVSTTVVEVGVDVKNATVMMIENADRFGLSALHQLRGRVGRNTVQSYCILVSDVKSEKTAQRLKVICDSTDGFVIAEKDLEFRGPGNFFGAEQHGLPKLKIAPLVGDMQILAGVSAQAETLLKKDPTLCCLEHQGVKKQVMALFQQKNHILN